MVRSEKQGTWVRVSLFSRSEAVHDHRRDQRDGDEEGAERPHHQRRPGLQTPGSGDHVLHIHLQRHSTRGQGPTGQLLRELRAHRRTHREVLRHCALQG